MTKKRGQQGVAIQIDTVLEALHVLDEVGSPVRPTQEVAELAVRRWVSFQRRNENYVGPQRDARIDDIALGFAERWDGSATAAGAMMSDYRWVASIACDALGFTLSAGSTGWSTHPLDEAIRSTGLERLHQIARTHHLRAQEDPYTGPYNRSFTTYKFHGRGPLWALLHRAVPVFAFSHEPPGGYRLEPEFTVIDPGLKLGPLLSADWRWLSPTAAETPLDDTNTVDLNEFDRNEIRHLKPRLVRHALFNTTD